MKNNSLPEIPAAQVSRPPWFEKLIDATRGIPEPKQRVSKILETLKRKDAKEIAAFLHFVSEPSGHPHPLVKRAHLDLIRRREDLQRLGYEVLAAVYGVASEETWKDVKALLRSSPSLRAGEEMLPEGFAKQLGTLTLGQRKQLGRDRRRKNIELLVFDSSPRVIRELLHNPWVTERDIVRVASRHQAPSEVLEEVFRSDRWMTQYSVKKALVFNPRTPISFALGLLNHLKAEDLRLVTSGGSSRKELLDAAREKLRKVKEGISV